MSWARREITISKRVLRLRACLYLKIRWVDTINIVNQLLGEGRLREVKDNKHWLAPPQYLNGGAQFREKYRDEFEKKKHVYDRWVVASSSAGYYAEELVKDAFIDAGYSAKKVLFECPEGFFSYTRYCYSRKDKRVICPRCGLEGTLHLKSARGWRWRYVRLGEWRYAGRGQWASEIDQYKERTGPHYYWYVAHYLGMKGKTSKVKWCYVEPYEGLILEKYPDQYLEAIDRFNKRMEKAFREGRTHIIPKRLLKQMRKHRKR